MSVFWGGLIDFTCKDEEKSLFYAFNSSFEAWKYFEEIFFYQYQNYLYSNDKKENSKTFWNNPKNWNSWDINVAQTEKGTKYFNEVLAPRFYNKYKDLEVEIDSKGNIIKWIGKINR